MDHVRLLDVGEERDNVFLLVYIEQNNNRLSLIHSIKPKKSLEAFEYTYR